MFKKLSKQTVNKWDISDVIASQFEHVAYFSFYFMSRMFEGDFECNTPTRILTYKAVWQAVGTRRYYTVSCIICYGYDMKVYQQTDALYTWNVVFQCTQHFSYAIGICLTGMMANLYWNKSYAGQSTNHLNAIWIDKANSSYKEFCFQRRTAHIKIFVQWA